MRYNTVVIESYLSSRPFNQCVVLTINFGRIKIELCKMLKKKNMVNESYLNEKSVGTGRVRRNGPRVRVRGDQ